MALVHPNPGARDFNLGRGVCCLLLRLPGLQPRDNVSPHPGEVGPQVTKPWWWRRREEGAHLDESVREEGILRAPRDVQVPNEDDRLARLLPRALHACIERFEEPRRCSQKFHRRVRAGTRGKGVVVFRLASMARRSQGGTHGFMAAMVLGCARAEIFAERRARLLSSELVDEDGAMMLLPNVCDGQMLRTSS